MKIMRPVAERRKRIEAALAAVGDSQDSGDNDAKTGDDVGDAKGEPTEDGDAKAGAVNNAEGEADAKPGSSDIDDVKSPSKEDGAVNDDADAKGGAVADAKGEPSMDDDDAKAGAKEDVADEK